MGVLVDEQEVNIAKAGENVVMRIKGIEEEEVLGTLMLRGPSPIALLCLQMGSWCRASNRL